MSLSCFYSFHSFGTCFFSMISKKSWVGKASSEIYYFLRLCCCYDMPMVEVLCYRHRRRRTSEFVISQLSCNQSEEGSVEIFLGHQLNQLEMKQLLSLCSLEYTNLCVNSAGSFTNVGSTSCFLTIWNLWEIAAIYYYTFPQHFTNNRLLFTEQLARYLAMPKKMLSRLTISFASKLW